MAAHFDLLAFSDKCKLWTYNIDESTAGADASVKVPKLHNIKLLAEFCCSVHVIAGKLK